MALKSHDSQELVRLLQVTQHITKLHIQSDLTQLPQEVCEQQCVTDLTLECPNLTSLPPGISLMNLNNLTITGCSQLRALPLTFGMLGPTLRRLDLSNNGLCCLPASMKMLQKLSFLNLSYNIFLHALPNLFHFPLLQTLNISNCPITTLFSGRPCMCRASSLRTIYASGCLLNNIDHIGSCQLLKKLDLADNVLETIPVEVTRLWGLKQLNLNSNPLFQLPESISSLKQLQQLDVSETFLVRIPYGIGQLKHLQVLKASYTLLRYLPYSIGYIRGLQHLDVSYCPLHALPQTLFGLPHLRFLYLSGTLLSIVPHEISEMDTLQRLSLEWVNLQVDSLPDLSHIPFVDFGETDLNSPETTIRRVRRRRSSEVSMEDLAYDPVEAALVYAPGAMSTLQLRSRAIPKP